MKYIVILKLFGSFGNLLPVQGEFTKCQHFYLILFLQFLKFRQLWSPKKDYLFMQQQNEINTQLLSNNLIVLKSNNL